MGRPVGILGTGAFLPGDPVGPERIEDVLGRISGMPPRLAARVDKMGPEVLARAGVKHRYYAIDPATRAQTETNASMAEKAVRVALQAAGVEAQSADLLVFAGPSSDYACPPTSAILQGRLGIRRCTEIEIHSNCTGAPKAIQVALDMIRAGRHRRAIVAYAQLSSTFLRGEYFNPAHLGFENLALRWIMSDGAGAMILDRETSGLALAEAYVESSGGDQAPGMIGCALGALGHETNLGGKNHFPTLHETGRHHIAQQIAEVARHAPRHLVDGLAAMLAAAGVAGDAVTHFLLGIPGRHFMSPEMHQYFRQTVGTDSLRAPFTIEDFGYCGGATMLIQFDRLVRSGRLQPGETVAAYLEESSKWMSGGFIAHAG
jgi:3-oxoacyl-[acyl-carrier-protein] synthase-3